MKRLVLCCDGTWNRADQQKDDRPCPTNVVKLAYRIAKRDERGIPQIIHYDQGVGTGNTIDRMTGGAFGLGLEDNIYDAYRFLVANYEAGDQLFLFGFSRGAFTARSIAGMIRKCGILSRTSIDRYREALLLYQERGGDADTPEAQAFRRDHSVTGDEPVEIQMLGVWDTVGSLGIPVRGLRGLTRRKYQFHDVELSGSVKEAYQALAIDEHRAPFSPSVWAPIEKEGQTIEQVWFCGAHSDVGGGYAENELSDITLQWMLEKVEGKLTLDRAVIGGRPLNPQPVTGKIHNSKTGLYRATPGIDREIAIAPADPSKPDENPTWPDPTQSIHPSVLERRDADPSYRPKSLRKYLERIGDRRAGR